jgi:hypothetical protein
MANVNFTTRLTYRAGFLLYLRGIERTLGRKLTATEHDIVVEGFFHDNSHDEVAFHLNRRAAALFVGRELP